LHSIRTNLPNGGDVAQRAFLRERPYALARPDILAWAHNYSQNYGVPVVLDHVLHQYGNIAFTTPPTASPATETQVTTPQPSPEPVPSMPQATQPPAPERDDNCAPHIASAPPSRSEYAGSMPPPEVSGRVTLSQEERSIAAATGISEIEYAKNKLKLLQMKKAGIIRD
jgi:hypothetical protein